MKLNPLHDSDIQRLSLLISGRIVEADWQHLDCEDWERLIQCAQIQGVGPLVYWAFSRAGVLEQLPEETQKALRRIYAVSQLEGVSIFQALENLAERFEKENLPVVVLKGACFALTIYPEKALRPMADLDLLVSSARLFEATKIARHLGYQDSQPQATAGLQDVLNHEVSLHKNEPQPISLELHRSLIADRTFQYAVPVDWFWEQTEPLPVQTGTPLASLLMLSPTAQLLYSAAHLALQHGQSMASLRWYNDLDLLVRAYPKRMDWALLILQSKEFKWGSAVYAALSKAQSLFDTPVPEQVMKTLGEQHDRHENLVRLKQRPPQTHVEEELQKLLSLDGYGRFRLILALVAPSPTYMVWRYSLKGKWQLPFYYLYRWMVILRDGFRTVFLWIRGKQKEGK